MEHWIDNLARMMARGVSRREALRQLGGLAGAVSGLLLTNRVLAQEAPNNDECAHFCTSVFTSDADRATCVSLGAQGGGPCYICGPECDDDCLECGDVPLIITPTTCTCGCPAGQKVCGNICIPNTACCVNGDCTGGKICQNNACVCPAGQKVCGNTCIPNSACCTSGDCPNGKVCQSGECVCSNTCPPGQALNPSTCTCGCPGGVCGDFATCGNSEDCICVKTAEGGGICAQSGTPCKGLTACTSTSECPGGQTCVVDSCCGKKKKKRKPGKGSKGVCVSASALCASSAGARASAKKAGPGEASLGRR